MASSVRPSSLHRPGSTIEMPRLDYYIGRHIAESDFVTSALVRSLDREDAVITDVNTLVVPLTSRAIFQKSPPPDQEERAEKLLRHLIHQTRTAAGNLVLRTNSVCTYRPSGGETTVVALNIHDSSARPLEKEYSAARTMTNVLFRPERDGQAILRIAEVTDPDLVDETVELLKFYNMTDAKLVLEPAQICRVIR